MVTDADAAFMTQGIIPGRRQRGWLTALEARAGSLVIIELEGVVDEYPVPPGLDASRVVSSINIEYR
jgi:hypothetical protein